MDEFSRISYWTNLKQERDHLEHLGVRLAIGDDAAVVAGPVPMDGQESYELLYTVDTMVENVHFTSNTMSFEHIGYKAMASNLSDIAAMGGIPLHALVAISIPQHVTAEQVKRIYDGIFQCANTFQVAVVGGDTTFSPHNLVLTITIIGQVEAGTALTRSGAQPGDMLVMTGVAGKSAAGLHLLMHPEQEEFVPQEHSIQLKRNHQLPKPHIAQARLLRQSGVCHSLNDISDGLASEAAEIAQASLVDLIIEEAKLPISDSLSRYASSCKLSMLDWILYGGEDYILVGTIMPQAYKELKRSFQQLGMQLYEIGYVEVGSGEIWLEGTELSHQRKERKRIEHRGYNHFT